MRFRLGLVTGMASGYYLGARAGRQRYDQINRSLAKLRRSEAFEVAVDSARSVVEDGVEKARSAVESRGDDMPVNGESPVEASGLILPTDPPTGLGDYSSSR